MQRDDHLTRAFISQYEQARAHLRAQMDGRGLTEARGWRIAETTRELGGAVQIVLRPIHSREPAPDDLECVVSLDESAGSAGFDCAPG